MITVSCPFLSLPERTNWTPLGRMMPCTGLAVRSAPRYPAWSLKGLWFYSFDLPAYQYTNKKSLDVHSDYNLFDYRYRMPYQTIL